MRIMVMVWVCVLGSPAAQALEWQPSFSSGVAGRPAKQGLSWQAIDRSSAVPRRSHGFVARSLAWEPVRPGEEISPPDVARELQRLEAGTELASSLLTEQATEWRDAHGRGEVGTSWEPISATIRECKSQRGPRPLPCLQIGHQPTLLAPIASLR